MVIRRCACGQRRKKNEALCRFCKAKQPTEPKADARLCALTKVAAAARAYVTVVGNDDAELDALVDALAALSAGAGEK